MLWTIREASLITDQTVKAIQMSEILRFKYVGCNVVLIIILVKERIEAKTQLALASKTKQRNSLNKAVLRKAPVTTRKMANNL